MRHSSPLRTGVPTATPSSPWRSRALALLLLAGLPGAGHAASPLFSEDFGKTELGKLPDGFLVLDGQFGAQADGNAHFLELPGAPLDTFGVMFGPGGKEDWGAQASFHGTSQGRRSPVFGISVNGVGGYRAQVAPAKKALELLKGDAVVASVPFSWESGSWTIVRVEVRKVGDAAWKVQGKAWKNGTPEPAAWMVTWNETEAPIAGRPAAWGKPFAGTPIRFDDFKVWPAEK